MEEEALMATLKGMYQEALRGNELVVTAPHVKWMETLEEEQIYSPEAQQFALDVWNRKYKHPRAGRFSPSAIGKCARRVVFGFAGAPQIPPDSTSQEMMDHGSWIHLKWQMEGITMGYMPKAEVWVHDDGLRVGGSMDGLLHDGSSFELKSAMWNVYNKVVTIERWPKWENLLQDATYKLLADIDWSSVVYEDRGNGQFHEYRVDRDAKVEAEALRRIRSYNAYVDEDELPPMLDECEMKSGYVYHGCPYRKICPMAKSVSEFGHVA